MTFATHHRQMSPESIYRLILAWFHPAAPTADIGCGSGRDVQWLAEHDYPVTGFDASSAMLATACEAYPDVDVRPAALPELVGVESDVYSNVLCSAVLMHIPREELITAVLNFARILRPSGRLLLSYRGSRGLDEREDDGRLFTAIPLGKLTLLLEAAGFQVLLTEEQPDADRSGIQWRQIVAEKSPLSVSRGLERVQSVLV